MSILLAGAIAGGASLVGQGINAYSQGKMNKRAERFSREMYGKQRADSLSDWNMQNAYNDPAQQMKRLQGAGLNPNLVYGNGADAQSQGAPKPVSSHQPNFKAPQMDFGSVIQNALATKQIQSQIAHTDAQTQAIKQSTEIGSFDLKAKQELGQRPITQQLEAKTAAMTAEDTQKVRQFEEWLDMAFKTGTGTSINVDSLGSYPSSGSKFVQDQVTAATKKAVMEIENIKSGVALRNQQQAINELEMVLKKAEADFTNALGSKTGAGFALQLLRTLLGK